jgi:hypothetical protein
MQVYFDCRLRGLEGPVEWKPSNKTVLFNSVRATTPLPIAAGFLISLGPIESGRITTSTDRNFTNLIQILCATCSQKNFCVKFSLDGEFEITLSFKCEHLKLLCCPLEDSCQLRYGFDCSEIWGRFRNREQIIVTPGDHPLRKIVAKLQPTTNDLAVEIGYFLQAIPMSESHQYLKRQAENHTASLDEFLDNLPGYKHVLVSPFPADSDSAITEFTYRKAPVVAIVWLAPWALSVGEIMNYMQLDGSFKITKPYVYATPQGIITNDAVPLGFVMGPTESSRLFKLFRDALIDCHFPEALLRAKPVLSDEGKGVMKYSRLYHDFFFFCYVHIIRKYGAGSPLAGLVRRALFCSCEAEYIAMIPQFSNDLLCFLTQGLITQAQSLEMIELLGLTLDKAGLVTGTTGCKHGLWLRAPFGVSTCNNHAEKFHGTLNGRTNRHYSLVERLRILVETIMEKRAKFEKNKNAQAKKIFAELKAKSGKKPDVCPHPNCNWGPVLAERYGSRLYPCPHIKPGCEPEFIPTPQLVDSLPTTPVKVTPLPPTDLWYRKLGVKKTKKFEFPEVSDIDRELHGRSDDEDMKQFLRELKSELTFTGITIEDHEDFLLDLGIEYMKLLQESGVKDGYETRAQYRAMCWARVTHHE